VVPLLFDYYRNNTRAHVITAKNDTPSIRAAATIMFDRISPLASGWRAIASIALTPIRLIPIAAPKAVSAAPMAAPAWLIGLTASAACNNTFKIADNIAINFKDEY
jgi:hypothetical protein